MAGVDGRPPLERLGASMTRHAVAMVAQELRARLGDAAPPIIVRRWHAEAWSEWSIHYGGRDVVYLPRLDAWASLEDGTSAGHVADPVGYLMGAS